MRSRRPSTARRMPKVKLQCPMRSGGNGRTLRCLPADWVILLGKNAGPFFERGLHRSSRGFGCRQSPRRSRSSRRGDRKQDQQSVGRDRQSKGDPKAEIAAEGARIQAETQAQIAKIQAQADMQIAAAAKNASLELKAYSAQLALALAEVQIRERLDSGTPGGSGQRLRERPPTARVGGARR